jgi:hypothetical protein
VKRLNTHGQISYYIIGAFLVALGSVLKILGGPWLLTFFCTILLLATILADITQHYLFRNSKEKPK